MADIVAISGDSIAPKGTVSQNLIEVLQDLLERAKSGEIVGIAGAMTYPSVTGYVLPAATFCAGHCVSTSAIGALEEIKYQLLKE